MKKVLLILVDGMRPDALDKCGHSYLYDLQANSTSTLNARTIMPSVTLPCHTSLFFSVPAERHGINTNTWIPAVRPIDGLTDVIHNSHGKSAFFTNWQQLRDLARPGTLQYHLNINQDCCDDTDERLTEDAIKFMGEFHPDFVFLYLGQVDEAGHHHGWMTPEYMKSVATASACIEKISKAFGEEYTIVVTADHGGHDRTHGTEAPEDMLIPLFFCGKDFPKGKVLEKASIMDIAPTITALMGLQNPPEWEGSSLL